MSWNGVITNAGQALLDSWSQGGHTLTIDGATVGSGITPAANMRIATALANEVGNASIARTDHVENGIRFKVQVAAGAAAFNATEIGLWAHLDSGSSVLLALHQDTDGGVAIPAASVTPDFVFALYLIHAVSNTEDLEVNVDTSALITASSLASTLENYVQKVSGKDLSTNDFTDALKAKLEGINKAGLDGHLIETVPSSAGSHGLRFYQDKLQYFDTVENDWVDIPMGVNVTYEENLSGGLTMTIGGE